MADIPKNKKKILAVASIGGHWIQLLRITAGLAADYDISYVSSNPKWADLVKGKFYAICEFSRWDAWKMFFCVPYVLMILLKEKPSVVLSTGAAPGLLVLLLAKYVFRKKTIWVDSIANVTKMSACGRYAVKLGIDHVYSQWEHLAVGKVKYAGNVLGKLGDEG
jgi:UDP-N-acetylglucosamine:LPS N-acetylglucosamine transferase